MRNYGSTIGVALKSEPNGFGRKFDAGRVAILREMVWQRIQRPEESDPIKVFIKREPHKLDKIATGRYRLISAVSLVDTMVDRVLFGRLCRKILSTVGETPCLIGWSPLRGGYHLLIEKFRGRTTRGLDKTAWDWTVSKWVLDATLAVLLELMDGAEPVVVDLARRRWKQLFSDAIFQFSDESQVKQPGWGVMKSGCYLTIVINSIGQMLYHALALKRLHLPYDSLRFVTIGDDVTVEDFAEFDQYERIIKHYGALLKPSEPTRHLQFAGFNFQVENGREECWPEYWQKHLYNVSHSQKLPAEALLPYLVLYANEPNFGEYVRSTMSVECPEALLTRRGCKSIWESITRQA